MVAVLAIVNHAVAALSVGVLSGSAKAVVDLIVCTVLATARPMVAIAKVGTSNPPLAIISRLSGLVYSDGTSPL